MLPTLPTAIVTLSVDVSPVRVSLPDGGVARVGAGDGWTVEQVKGVWRAWLALAPLAAARGEGVTISEDGEYKHVETVYAPQWERMDVSIDRTGALCWCGEQSAPKPMLDLL